MNPRKLRIAWSVGWGVVAVLLCLLWVRSYWRFDGVEYDYRTSSVDYGECVFGSFNGRLLFGYYPITGESGFYWKLARKPEDAPADFFRTPFALTSNATTAPHWFVAILFAALAAAPWIPPSNRFSLRTLLIATTLVALALGLIVWASH